MSASLRVQGDELDFEEISRATGVAFSKVIKKGSFSKVGKKYEVDTWIFASRLPEYEPLESHVRWFTETLPETDHIKNLRSIQGLEDVDIVCAVSADSTTCSISVPADVLNTCAMMAADLEISLVFGNMAAGSNEGGQPTEVNLDSTEGGLRQRANAGLRGKLLPGAQTLLRDALRHSSGARSISQALSSAELEVEFDVAFRTAMVEDESPDAQLRKLDEALHSRIQQLKDLGDAASFAIESRFETNCEWASTRLSWQAFNLPVLLNCPLILQAVLF